MQLFNRMVQCEEFGDYQLRANDKKTLNEINGANSAQNIRFPIEGKINKVEQKISW